MPTTGNELIQAWELSPDAWGNESVKVSRCVPGTNRVELLQSCALSEYDLEALARDFGPGAYRINPGPGPNAKKVCTIQVSSEYARRAGWATPPPERSPSEIMAQRTFQQAQQGPVDPVALSQMIELAVMKAQAQNAPRTDNGMDALTLVLKGFDLAGTLQTKALETAQKMAGIAPAANVEREPASMADVLLQLGPSILATVSEIVKAPQGRNHNMQTQKREAPQDMGVREIQPMTTTPEAPILPDLTEDEKTAIAPIVGTLRPFADKLVPFLNSPTPASILAGQLAGMMGPDLDLPALALAACVRRVGPGVLAAIHPGFATEKGAAVVSILASKVADAQGDGEGE
jgi:hypothetical protein